MRIRSSRTRAYLLANLALLVLGACAAERGVLLPELDDWERRKAVLAGIDDFDFRGRIAVRTGDDGFNGKLRWQQDGDAFRATVGGPLGIGTVLIEGNGSRVELTDNDGEVTVLEDVEPELYLRYGWTIPVESLRYWVLGIPDPAVPAATRFGEDDELATLEQRGWQVTFSRYRDAGGGQPMPALLAAGNGNTSVRIVIDRRVFNAL